MTHQEGTVGELWSGGRSNSQGHKRVMIVALSLLAVALAVASIYLFVSTSRTDAGSGIMAGVEASSARWNALGAANAPDYATVADVSSARWSALGENYAAKAAQGQ